jgi:uncharacterized damage-inducible protein DinB
MKEYYVHLFDYNDWANRLVINSLKENSPENEKIHSLFSHLIIAQILWLNRLKKEEYEIKDFWQLLDLNELDKLIERSTFDWKTFIKMQDEKELQSIYSYRNSKGKRYDNTLAQIMTHVINHSTYHRAQVAALLREENINPPLTDYIAFFR